MADVVYFNHGFSMRNAFELIRLESQGRVVIAASSKNGLDTPMVASADIRVEEPAFDPGDEPDRYVEGLLRTCLDLGVALFVPQRGLRQVAERLHLFEEAGIRVQVPADASTLDAIDDKWSFTQIAKSFGLPVARTWEVRSGEELRDAIARLAAEGLRACVKPPIGVYGSGFWIVDDLGAPFKMLNDESRRMPSAAIAYALDDGQARGLAPRLLACELLPGVETSVDALCEDGRVVAAVSRSKYKSSQILGVDGPCMDLAAETIRAFGLSGLVNVQMKERADGTPALLEINPRMSGGCMYTLVAGVNLPWLSVALPLGHARRELIPTPRGGALVAGVTETMTIRPSAR